LVDDSETTLPLRHGQAIYGKYSLTLKNHQLQTSLRPTAFCNKDMRITVQETYLEKQTAVIQ
jgi:hypothetical protein